MNPTPAELRAAHATLDAFHTRLLQDVRVHAASVVAHAMKLIAEAIEETML